MMALNNLAYLYRERGETDEAKHLFVRALAALEATAGPDDPAMVTVLRNLAVLCEETGDRSYAKALSRRARAIEATVSRTQVAR
jgi:Flp pilus assembly protein TadD